MRRISPESELNLNYDLRRKKKDIVELQLKSNQNRKQFYTYLIAEPQKYMQNLAEFSGILQNLADFCGIFQNLAKS